MSIVGFFLPLKPHEINLEQVVDVDTVCSVLCAKGKLSQEDYNFEHQVVASHYNDLTFTGYLFIMKPFIYNLKNNNYFDGLFQYLVSRWILVHKSLNNQKINVRFSHKILAKVSTQIAFFVGRVLSIKRKHY